MRRALAPELPGGAPVVGFLEGDSVDATYAALDARLPDLRRRHRRAGLWKRDFGFRIPSGSPRWAPAFQIARRTVISARSA